MSFYLAITSPFLPKKRLVTQLNLKRFIKFPFIVLFIVAIYGDIFSEFTFGKNEPLVLSRADYIWNPDINSTQADTHAAFRGSFSLEETTALEYRVLAASVFTIWLDGQFITEGPARYPSRNPEYQVFHFNLSKGQHTLAIQVHHQGVHTRILGNQAPFVWSELQSPNGMINVKWLTSLLEGYTKAVRRINPQLGWIEWCDTRKNPKSWQSNGFNDDTWTAPTVVKRDLGHVKPLETHNLTFTSIKGSLIDAGYLSERFGYEKDNPSARFYLRDLKTSKKEASGIWRRYDLGRIRLVRPEFKLSLPEGAIVEWAFSEQLVDSRVNPWINLSGGDSCNLDHYVARGGTQVFSPLSEHGGRYLELHILGDLDKIKILDENFIDRGYFSEITGAFKTTDPVLNTIWKVGIETLKACSEDAIIDNPTRERGQWTGDLGIGLDTASAGFNDLALCKRGLIQSAECARKDGLVSGMSPGQDIFISSYAAQWVDACVHYWELTGDLVFLQNLYPSAVKNINAFEAHHTQEGIKTGLSWDFIDWGYVNDSKTTDQALNLFYLSALRSMVRWSRAIGDTKNETYYVGLADKMTETLTSYFNTHFSYGDSCWKKIGYHRAVLGLRLNLFKGIKKQEAIAAIKKHILASYPNRATAPRLSSPSVVDTQLITPYFSYFTYNTLLELGETDFVLNQYKTCWGSELTQGQTTWMEVFDSHWSGCHQWSACPTSQLSQWILGLQSRFDLGTNTYRFNLRPGSLTYAEGKIPYHNQSGAIHIKWFKNSSGTHVQIDSHVPITLHVISGGEVKILNILGTTNFDI